MKYKFLFFLILVVAIFLRFYKLGALPDGMTWDEAAIGYNAYGLITNHRDEWLKRTPLVFQSFGDFKSPLLIYLVVFPILLFGLTPFAIRVVVASSGLGVVVTSFFLAREVLKRIQTKESKSNKYQIIPLIVMLFTTFSPWAVHYSRLAFESMLACFCMVFGVLCFLVWERTKNRFFLLGSVISFVSSLYAYHSAKVVLPLLVVILGGVFATKILSTKKQVFMALVMGIMLLLPLGYVSLFGKANARALTTTVLNSPHALQSFALHYLLHLSPSFLLQGKDVTYRHSTMLVGALHPVELFLFVVAVLLICTQKKYKSVWWIPALFFIGIIPAALGIDVPHSNRALLSFPWILIASIIPLHFLFEGNAKKSQFLLFAGIVIVGLEFFSSYRYLQIYRSTYTNSQALEEFGYGYKELLSFVRPLEGNVDRVYFTNSYGQAYIYILFFKHLTPMEYQHGGLANYTITSDPWKEANGKKNVLIVGTADQVPEGPSVLKEISYPDGKIAFRVARQ